MKWTEMTGRPVLVLTEWPVVGILIVLVFQRESLGFLVFSHVPACRHLSACSSL